MTSNNTYVWTDMFIFFKVYIYLFLERGWEGKREGEKHQCVVASHALYGDLAHDPGMCPDWESNWWPFGLQAGAQCTELHQPGLNWHVKEKSKHLTY